MNDGAFGSTLRALDSRPCVFEQTILANYAACSLASKSCVGQGEGIHCGSEEAQAKCAELIAILRREARFALHNVDAQGAISHAQSMRVQVGGLRGLCAILAPDDPVPARVSDIRRTVTAILDEIGDLTRLPFQSIVREIAAYRPKRRTRGRE